MDTKQIATPSQLTPTLAIGMRARGRIFLWEPYAWERDGRGFLYGDHRRGSEREDVSMGARGRIFLWDRERGCLGLIGHRTEREEVYFIEHGAEKVDI